MREIRSYGSVRGYGVIFFCAGGPQHAYRKNLLPVLADLQHAPICRRRREFATGWGRPDERVSRERPGAGRGECGRVGGTPLHGASY